VNKLSALQWMKNASTQTKQAWIPLQTFWRSPGINDRLLEIEEAMESLRDLHEFRKEQHFKPVQHNDSKWKPVKIGHQHLWDPVKLLTWYHYRHRSSNAALRPYVFHHPDIPLRTPVLVNQLQQRRQPYALRGAIPPIIKAAAMMKAHNAILIGGGHDIHSNKNGHYQYALTKNTF
jgi:hypothetical protein